ncbi:MurR/RpiR family transcriptional regulator [Peribacillus sp. B-H-3]|uniref:MurR/RpiR family transcriptional regulator n=1 Tax=Peribacillus sp. B-H-3 TaxID=3400420 RepID=UPI003B01FA57
MNEISILAKIRKNLSLFTDAEGKVAGYILDHPGFIPTMTTKELAKQSDSSEASVVRFCKTIGAGNFKMLKIMLAKENTIGDENINHFALFETEDTPLSLFQKVTYLNKAAIELSIHTLDKKEFEQAASHLKSANKIAFFGVGGSFPPAIDAQYKFMKLGLNATASSDFHYAVSQLSMMKQGDLLVIISTSGKTKESIELAQYAKEQGVVMAAITALRKSPLYKMADIKLCIPDVEEEQRVGSIASRMAQLNIIDALYLSLFHEIGKEIYPSIHKSKEMLSKRK